MRRGTTPTFQITVTGLSDIEIDVLWLTLKQDTTEITKDKNGVEIQGDVISAALTQEETLGFKVGAKVGIQLRALSTNNTAYASNIVYVDVKKILRDGVISDEAEN